MATCFVIQPFDGDVYDKRYADVFEPAIRQSGLDPYRVDQDPGASIPIDDIEDGIRSAEVCFAEISTDNPNVWFELGYAIAARKEVILVCSDERKSKFPFDVQHRRIIKYKRDAPSDFESLKKSIIEGINALLEKEERISEIAASPVLEPTEGLSDHEIVTLVTIAKGVGFAEGGISLYGIKRDCEKAGYTEIAVILALRTLIKRKYIEQGTDYDENGNQFNIYCAAEPGMNWLECNKSLLVLKRKKVNAMEEVPF